MELEISIPVIEIFACLFSSLKTNTTNTIDTPLWPFGHSERPEQIDGRVDTADVYFRRLES